MISEIPYSNLSHSLEDEYNGHEHVSLDRDHDHDHFVGFVG